MKPRLAARWLVALYPKEWRREYGLELMDLIGSRPVTLRVAADVMWSALRERLRASYPSAVLGVATLLLILGGFVLAGRQWTALLQPAMTTFPPAMLTFLRAEVYVLRMIACGCWTYLRYGASLTRSGTAAMKMSLIAGVPIVICALLMMLGVVDLTFGEPQRVRPLPWVMMLSPVLRLPEAWIWGIAGGLLGRWRRPNRSTS
jgi:hypothetical protein